MTLRGISAVNSRQPWGVDRRNSGRAYRSETAVKYQCRKSTTFVAQPTLR
jgi:hypothetical protein